MNAGLSYMECLRVDYDPNVDVRAGETPQAEGWRVLSLRDR